MGRKINRVVMAERHTKLHLLYRKLSMQVQSGKTNVTGTELTPAERRVVVNDLRELARRHETRAREIKETI